MEKISCFVIMPFSDTKFFRAGNEIIVSSEEWTYIFNHWIKKAVESYSDNIDCNRSPLAPGNFIKGIVEDISDSDITIADLTGGKPNVYYELGIRHSLRNGTIIITQNINDLPSDLNSLYCFEYGYTNKSYKYDASFKKFEENIHRLIKHILANNYPSDNPVSEYLEFDKYKNQKVEEFKFFSKESFVAKRFDEHIVIPIKDILFLEARGAYTHIYLIDGTKRNLSKPLKHILLSIDHDSIVRVHRSYAVNKYKVRRIKRNTIILRGSVKGLEHRIPISNSFRASLGL